MARQTKAGRNDLCSCGSGKKSKKCCQAAKPSAGWSSKVMLGVVLLVIVGAVIAGIMSFNDGSVGPAPGKVWSQEHGHYH